MNTTFYRLEVGEIIVIAHDDRQRVLAYDWYFQPDPKQKVCVPSWREVRPPDGAGLGGADGRGQSPLGSAWSYWLPVVDVLDGFDCAFWLDDALGALGQKDGHLIAFIRPPGQFALAWSDTAFPPLTKYRKTDQPLWWGIPASSLAGLRKKS